MLMVVAVNRSARRHDALMVEHRLLLRLHLMVHTTSLSIDAAVAAPVTLPSQPDLVTEVGETRDKKQHLERREAGDGAYHGLARRSYYLSPLGQLNVSAVDVAVLAVDGVTVVVALGVDIHSEAGAQRGVGPHGREPEDSEEQVDGKNCPVVVRAVPRGDLLGQEGIADRDESEQALSTVSNRGHKH